MKITSLTADLLLLAVAVIWGSGYIVIKLLFPNMNVEGMLFSRFFLAALFVMVLNLKNIRRLFRVKPKTVLAGFILGAFFSAGFFSQSYGIFYTTVGNSSFITGLNIVFVPFIFWGLTKKRPPLKSFAGVFVGLAGMSVLMLDFSGGLTFNKGDLLVLFCAVCFAVQIVLTGIFVNEHDFQALTFFELLTVCLFSGAGLLIKGGGIGKLTLSDGFLILYLGLVVTGLAALIQTFAQRFTHPTHTALILALEAVFGSIFGVIFLKEIFTFKMLAGCAIIILGILISELSIPFGNKVKTEEAK